MSEYNSLYDWLESCKLAIYIDNFVKGGFDMISITGLTPEVKGFVFGIPVYFKQIS